MNYPSVPRLLNGVALTEETVNRPIDALRARTDCLAAQYADLVAGSAMSSTKWPAAPLSTGDDAPELHDVVSYDPDTRVFRKAIASIDVANRLLLDTDYAGFGVGILTLKSDDGTTGTVVMNGRLPLTSTDGDWQLSEMMEDGATYRNGPLYLSSVTAGKLATNPAGPAIYIGFFVDDANGAGGNAVLSVQYRDFFHAHTHRAFSLSMKPAGSQVHTGTAPDGTHTSHGLATDAWAADYHGTHSGSSGATLGDDLATFALDDLVGLRLYNVTQGGSGVITANDTTTVTADIVDDDGYPVEWETDDQYKIGDRARLFVTGTYTGTLPTQYTCTLTDSGGSAAPVTEPDGFDDVWLKWVSDDPDEGDGLVRITSYEQPISIGTKGVTVRLENFAEGDWAWAPIGDDNVERRRWTFTAPDHVRGWSPHREAAYVPAVVQAADLSHRLLVFGDKSGLERSTQNINVLAACIHQIAYSDNPADGDTLTIGGVVFEFDSDDSATGIAVTIADTAAGTYENLLQAVLDYGFTDVTPVLAADEELFLIGTLVATSVSADITYAALTVPVSGADQDLSSGGDGLLVFDDENLNLVDGAGYWNSDVTYYAPLTLTHGLQLMFVPYAPDGTAATAHTIETTDLWRHTAASHAVGAKFVYLTGMHAALDAVFPPVPYESADITVEGVSMASRHIQDERYVFSIGPDGIYWYPDGSSACPWPFDWVSVDSPGELHTDGIAYISRQRFGDSGCVTSLSAPEGSAVRITRRGTTDAASTGALDIDIDLNLSQINADQAGHNVVKTVRGGRLVRGPVVERVEDGPGYVVRSKPGARRGQGTIQLVLTGHASLFADADLVLRGAKQDLISEMFPAIKFLEWTSGSTSNVPTALIGKFTVPFNLAGAWRFNLFATFFGYESVATGVQYAGFDITYKVLRDYAPGSDYTGTLYDNVIEPADAVHIEVPFGNAASDPAYSAGDPRIVHTSEEYALAADRLYRVADGPYPTADDLKGGETVASLSDVLLYGGSQVVVQISRADSTEEDEYTPAVGLLNLRYQLVAAD